MIASGVDTCITTLQTKITKIFSCLHKSEYVYPLPYTRFYIKMKLQNESRDCNKKQGNKYLAKANYATS